uniref:Uncharacterized protein n=1 Tax=Medicago truncatula TaxID=3880 RepID=I3SUU0_MEDTR|nr:unknown [Medicago truncatula]
MGEADASKGLKTQAQTMNNDNRSDDFFGAAVLLNWITVQFSPREAFHPFPCQTILLILKVVMAFRLILQNLSIMVFFCGTKQGNNGLEIKGPGVQNKLGNPN